MPKEDKNKQGVNESTLKGNISTDKFTPEIKASIKEKSAQFVMSQTVTK